MIVTAREQPSPNHHSYAKLPQGGGVAKKHAPKSVIFCTAPSLTSIVDQPVRFSVLIPSGKEIILYAAKDEHQQLTG